MATDVRSIPDWMLNAFLYPIAGWGVGYGILYFVERDAWAIPLLFPLALWQIGLTTFWAARTARMLRAGELTAPEVHAGIRSIGGITSADAVLPAVVFLVNDPLHPSAQGTALGVLVVAAFAYGLVQLGHRWQWMSLQAVILGFACLALPINATGAVTVAEMVGWFDKVAAPGKDLLDRNLNVRP